MSDAQSPRPVRQRPRRSRLGLVFVLVVLGWGAWQVFQAATTSDLSADDLAYVARPYVTYGLKPSFTREGEPRRTANALGYRGAEIELPKPAGRVRVVCLGGSTTYGFAVADDETYPARLEHHLRAIQPDLDVDVVNAGVESYTTAESLANLTMRVLELEPDMIVIHHAPNDVRPRRYANFGPDYAHYRKPWSGSAEGYQAVGGELGGINWFIQQPPPEPAGDAAANLANAGVETFRRNVLSMIGVARIHGVTPVLTTFAIDAERARGAEQQPEMVTGVEQHNEVMRLLGADIDVGFVELEPLEQRRDWFVDSVHLNAAGCDEKARLVAEGIAPLLP